MALLGFKPQTVIDVGVAQGTPELYSTFPTAKHLLIEPLQEFEPALQGIAHSYDADYVVAAAASSAGRITIEIYDPPDSSSLLKGPPSGGASGQLREIPAVTIDGLCATKDLRPPFLLKVDVQGAELEVLGGASKTLRLTEVVVLETSLFRFWDDSPQLFDVLRFMKERNFVAYDFFGPLMRPLDGALAQIDVAFVKEDGFFRKSHMFRATTSDAEPSAS